MSLKHFFEVYSPLRMWRKMWLGFASLPMLPQHRARILALGGGKIKGTGFGIWWCADRYGGSRKSLYRQQCGDNGGHKDSDSLP